ncbi:MAG: AAA family ATPase [Cyanobacteria bacterium J06635_11]
MIPRRTLPLNTWIDQEMSKPGQKWLIKDLILEDGVNIIAGPPTLAFKSWTMYALGLIAASGQSKWGIEPTGAFPVWFMQLESPGRPTAERFLKIQKGIEANPVAPTWISHLSAHRFDVRSDVTEICKFIEQEGIKILFVDTLAKARSRGSESSADDIGALFREVDRIRALGCSTVFAHHTRKLSEKDSEDPDSIDPDQILRGSTAIAGAYDCFLGIIPDFTQSSTKLRWIRRSNEAEQMMYQAEWHIGTDSVDLDLRPWDSDTREEVSVDKAVANMQPGRRYTKATLEKMLGARDDADFADIVDALQVQGILEQAGTGGWKRVET